MSIATNDNAMLFADKGEGGLVTSCDNDGGAIHVWMKFLEGPYNDQ